MNKKLFLGMFAAAGMLFATSCSNDELDPVQSSSDQAQVTFSLGLEGGMATRAISDGTGAKKLVYAVYKLDAQNNPVLQPVVGSDENSQFVDGKAFDNGLTETVSVTLAKGQTYQIAFWAQNPSCSAYTTTDLTNVGISYTKATNNNESRDAFFKTVEFTVQGNQTIDVELKRPFAQINVGVTKADWDAAVASGINIEKSSVVIKNAATSINLLTGAVGDETTDVIVSYKSNTIPSEDLKVDLNKDGNFGEDEKYKWLSMSYILVADHDNATDANGVLGTDRTTLQGLEYTFTPASGNTIEFKEGLAGAPVQRNWRTNILGKILTGDIQFNITINPIYDGDINVDAPTSEVKSDAESLAAALTANEENIVVVLGADVDLPITSLGSQTPSSGEYKLGGEKTKNITIDLNGKTLNLTTTYWSAIGAKNDDATFTIKNGTMTSTGNSAGTWNAWDLRFSNCNYVFEGVKFNKAVALDNVEKSTKMKNVTITDTHDTDTYGLWITAEGQTVTLEDCLIDMTPATDGRGIKIDNQYIAEADQKKVTLNLTNVTFKTEEKAAIMVKSAQGADINVSNINISEVSADKVFAVWVDEDAAAYADKVTVTGALKKIENDKSITGATSAVELIDKLGDLKNGDNIKILLGDNISLTQRLNITEGVVVNLDMNGKTIELNGTSADPAFYTYKGSTLTITGNGTVEIKDPSVSLMFPGGDVVIENGTFIRNVPAGTPAKEVGAFFVGAKVSPWGSQTVTIKGGYFDGGYYNADAADIEDILAGTKTLTETADDIAKRGNSKDANKVRVAIKQNVQLLLNLSYNLFKVKGGTFVGANPAWGDEGCMLPTTPNYLRPWSYYQGPLLEGQTFDENGIVLPAGYEITKGSTTDGRPTYTVKYNN